MRGSKGNAEVSFSYVKLYKKIGIGMMAVFAGIQLIRPSQNHSKDIRAAGIATTIAVPQDVQNLLSTACYDCHSNNTRYPWYADVQPVGWYLSYHINEGKRALNFSELGTYTKRKQESSFRSIANQVADGEMPLSSYTRLHPHARLTAAQRKSIVVWARSSADALAE